MLSLEIIIIMCKLFHQCSFVLRSEIISAESIIIHPKPEFDTIFNMLKTAKLAHILWIYFRNYVLVDIADNFRSLIKNRIQSVWTWLNVCILCIQKASSYSIFHSKWRHNWKRKVPHDVYFSFATKKKSWLSMHVY